MLILKFVALLFLLPYIVKEFILFVKCAVGYNTDLIKHLGKSLIATYLTIITHRLRVG
jgi:L-cystine uptake protein TcyP (sodium:dicarboxylate symporter family)